MARPVRGLFGNGVVSPDILLSDIEQRAPIRERRPLALFKLKEETRRLELLQQGGISQPASQRGAIPGGSPKEIYPGGPTKGEVGIPDIIHPIQAGSPTRPIAPPPISPELAPTSMILGAVGTLFSSGFLTDLQEYNSQFIGRAAFPIYDKMRRTCSDVAAVESAVALPVLATPWDIVPGADPNDAGYKFALELADMVRENLFGGLEAPLRTGGFHSQTWRSVLQNALLAPTFGCSAHEMCWNVDGDRIRLTALVPRLPLTFYRWWVDYDGYTLLAMEQLGYRRNEFANVIVPAQKLSTFAVNKEGANFFGRSIYRAAYMSFYYLDFLTRIDGIASEHCGVGVPVIEETEPGVTSPKDAEICKNYVTKVAANENLGISLPYGHKFSMKGVEGREHNVLASMQYHAAKIYMTALAGHLHLAERSTGSYGMSESLADFFNLAENSLADMIAEEINCSVIRRLVDYNYEIPHALRVDKMPYPLLKPAKIAVLNVPLLLDKLRYLAQDNVDLLHPDDKFETWVRSLCGAPPPENPRPRYKAITQTEREVLPAVPGETIPEEPAEGPDADDTGGGQADIGKKLALREHGHMETLALPDKFPPYARTGLNKIDKRGQMRLENRLAQEMAAEFRTAKRALISSAKEHAGKVLSLADRDLFRPQVATPEIVDRIKDIIRQAMTYGHDSVYRERFRATGRRRNQAVLQLRDVKLQDEREPGKIPQRTPEEIAWLAAAEAEDWMVVKARNLMLEALRRGLSGDLASAFIGSEFEAATDGALDIAGLRATRDGVQMGRLGAYRKLAPEIAKLVRQEMADERVCSVCDEHDGDTWDDPEDVDWWPGSDCLGGRLCRGDLVTVFLREGTYQTRS